MDYQSVVEISGVFGLFLFIGLFASIVWWVMRPSAKDRFDRDAEIPFKED